MFALRFLSYPKPIDPTKVICVWGDSTTNGAGATAASSTARSVLSNAFTPTRYVINLGIGGEVPEAVADRFLARPSFMSEAVHIIWFGRANYSAAASDFVTQADRCWAARDSDRMLFLLPAPGANTNEMTAGSGQIIINNTARAEMLAAYPDNHIDQMQAMWDAITGSDSADDIAAEGIGYCPPKFISNWPADSIHRNNAGQAIEGTAIYDAIVAKGW
jgi:hypothetical protein